jgi:hypothetical protein
MAGHLWGFQLQHQVGRHERPRQSRWCGADQGASRPALSRRGVSHERGILTLSTGAAPAFGGHVRPVLIEPSHRFWPVHGALECRERGVFERLLPKPVRGVVN